jgi:hypothetical protein
MRKLSSKFGFEYSLDFFVRYLRCSIKDRTKSFSIRLGKYSRLNADGLAKLDEKA